MGLFDGLGKQKVVAPNTSVKYTNNITERLTSLLAPRFASAKVYLVESGDPKFVNIRIDGVNDVLGVITRDKRNIVVNIGLYTRGVVNAFSQGAEQSVAVYLNRELDNVVNPY